MPDEHAVVASEPLVPPFEQRAGSWDGATWMGWIDDEDARLRPGDRLPLRDGKGFRRARILVRHHGVPRGVAAVAVADAGVDVDELLARIGELPVAGELSSVPDDELPALTVALCTRDRADQLSVAIRSLLALSYPRLQILIVDNASRTDDAARQVAAIDDERVRLVYEPRPGLSCARNRALMEADTDWVVFTDDDVAVDPDWLRGLARGIRVDPDCGLVCGAVATGELISSAQMYFERRVAWVGATNATVFSLADPPADIPMFPFEVGLYGTGANFAVDRRLAVELGGYNEALGAGTPTGGGEDIDMFVRVVVSGRTLVKEPSALVWHRHRPTTEELAAQLRSYGTGMAAWILSCFGNAQTRRLAARRLSGGVLRLARFGAAEDEPDRPAATADPVPPAVVDGDVPTDGELRRIEITGLLSGPWAYLRSRAHGRAARPLDHARP